MNWLFWFGICVVLWIIVTFIMAICDLFRSKWGPAVAELVLCGAGVFALALMGQYITMKGLH